MSLVIKFEMFLEFPFGIRGPKLARRDEEYSRRGEELRTLSNHNIRDNFFYTFTLHWGGQKISQTLVFLKKMISNFYMLKYSIKIMF